MTAREGRTGAPDKTPRSTAAAPGFLTLLFTGRARSGLLAPPGIDGEAEQCTALKLLAGAAAASAVWYAMLLFSSIEVLYRSYGGMRTLCPGASMPYLAALATLPLAMFRLALPGCIALAAWHYASHFWGSKSIYLMRRLPAPFARELWQRCLVLPVRLWLASLAVKILLFDLYSLLYRLCTPADAMQAQTIRLWAILWGGLPC